MFLWAESTKREGLTGVGMVQVTQLMQLTRASQVQTDGPIFHLIWIGSLMFTFQHLLTDQSKGRWSRGGEQGSRRTGGNLWRTEGGKFDPLRGKNWRTEGEKFDPLRGKNWRTEGGKFDPTEGNKFDAQRGKFDALISVKFKTEKHMCFMFHDFRNELWSQFKTIKFLQTMWNFSLLIWPSHHLLLNLHFLSNATKTSTNCETAVK